MTCENFYPTTRRKTIERILREHISHRELQAYPELTDRMVELLDQLVAQAKREAAKIKDLKCLACGNTTLFLGTGGYITCSWIECLNPSLTHDKLAALNKEVK